MSIPWPGNVRELENIIERAVLVCDEDTILSVHLPPSLQRQEPRRPRPPAGLASQVEKLEKEADSPRPCARPGATRARRRNLLDTSLRILGYKIKQFGNRRPGASGPPESSGPQKFLSASLAEGSPERVLRLFCPLPFSFQHGKENFQQNLPPVVCGAANDKVKDQ